MFDKKEYNRQYREQHKNYMKIYYQKNKERFDKHNKQYYLNNKNKISIVNKIYQKIKILQNFPVCWMVYQRRCSR